jgi:hypothetical protein
MTAQWRLVPRLLEKSVWDLPLIATRFQQAANQRSENYKPFFWCRLRAKPFVASLLNGTEDGTEISKFRLCASKNVKSDLHT